LWPHPYYNERCHQKRRDDGKKILFILEGGPRTRVFSLTPRVAVVLNKWNLGNSYQLGVELCY
jgi:hypothetical protein